MGKNIPHFATGLVASSNVIDPGHDQIWLQRLVTAEITHITLNNGGLSLTLRVFFADGHKAVFKPHQKMIGSHFQAEIAAYHLDRLLGLHRVAPVAGRPLSFSWLKHQFAKDTAVLTRIDNDLLPDGDLLWGAMIAWHTQTPTVADPPRDWVSRFNPTEETYLALSDMVLFDALIDNTDRWSGGNIMTLGPKGPLIFLDNASAFLGYRARQHAFLSKPTEQLCHFRESTIAALRQLSPSAPREHRLSSLLAASLAHDPATPVLSQALFKAMDERHERILRHLDHCESPGKTQPKQ